MSALVVIALGSSAARAEIAAPPAEADRLVHVTGAGACPRPEAVAAALEPVSPRGEAGLGRPRVAEVADLGDGFRVTVGRESRAYRDPQRDCAERTRVAAVYIVLMAFPPDARQGTALPSSPPPPASPAPPPAATAASVLSARPGPAEPPPARRLAWLTLEAAVRLEGAPAPQGGAVPGLMSRVAFGPSPRWGISLGAGLLAPSTLELDGASARERRFPLEAGVRVPLRLASLEIAGDAGLGGALFTTDGRGIASARHQTRIDLGLRAGVAVRLVTASRLTPYLGLAGTYYPRPYGFVVDGAGAVGQTPAWRLAAEAGIAFALR